jgi:CheY-like chemotaxis protein/AraC-like DNA-binding protein
MADEERLERAVSNLLDNAFKFTPAGGTVALTMIHEGEWATMAVEDTGPGIPPADLPRLFERFYRGARDAEQIPGTGIGLALAREYVEMHGGTIAAENRPGGGARFIIRLPADAAASARTMPAPPTAGPQPTGTTPDDERAEESVVNERANTGPATVLVIEDHPDMRAYVRKHLAPHYRVIEAARGDEGLEAVRAELPDVIVCDVMMPGLDGFALCRAIKADPETDFLPIVMLTAKAGPEGRLAGLEQGADDYLTKPFVPAELLARIRNLLTSRERLKAHLIDRQPVPVRLAAPRVMPSADETLLNRLRDVLDSAAHDEEFDVPALAAGVGMSRAQLHRRLRSAFQTTPAEMIVEYRLQRAVQMLEGRAGNVSEVAYAVGFKNVSHFVRRFRERHGQTPASWASSRVDHRQ